MLPRVADPFGFQRVGLSVEVRRPRCESHALSDLNAFTLNFQLLTLNLHYQCLSVVPVGLGFRAKKIAASVSRPRVWWLEPKRSAALHGGATGGMSADILLAHSIAAAKVRRQFQVLFREFLNFPMR